MGQADPAEDPLILAGDGRVAHRISDIFARKSLASVSVAL